MARQVHVRTTHSILCLRHTHVRMQHTAAVADTLQQSQYCLHHLGLHGWCKTVSCMLTCCACIMGWCLCADIHPAG